MKLILRIFPLMLISVQGHRSNQDSFDASVESAIKHNYADIGIERYFNGEDVLPKIDPNIAEDARLDTVLAKLFCKLKIILLTYCCHNIFFNSSPD